MRHKVEAPYVRGEATKARILDVAITLFGTKGFDSVPTREIAQAASVPQASLRYYFISKEGLYIACLEHIQAQIARQMEPALSNADALLTDQDARLDALIESFCALQEAMIDIMIGGKDGGTAALLLVRHDLPSESGSGTLAGDETSIRRIAACFTDIMVRISAGRLDRPSAARLTGMINGQITNIYLRRNRLVGDGWDITLERLDWIKRMIRFNTTAILQAHR